MATASKWQSLVDGGQVHGGHWWMVATDRWQPLWIVAIGGWRPLVY